MNSYWAWVAVVGAVLAPVMWLLSRSVEFRAGRWRKILFTAPAILLLAWGFDHAVAHQGDAFFTVGVFSGATILFALIWMPELTHIGASGFSHLLYGDGRAGGGFVPDYKDARWKIEEGNLEAAIKLTKDQLAKSPTDYEGLILLATLYNETDRPKEALAQLERILSNPLTTDTQRREVMGAKLDLINTHKDLLS
jgi:hypothetical protein